MTAPDSAPKAVRLVIAGGGVAALEALVALHTLVPQGLDVVLVSPSEGFSHRPMQVGEPFGFGDSRRYPLDALCRDLGARFVHDGAIAVDPDSHTVELAGGDHVGYELLLLAVGAQAHPAFENGVTFDRETLPEEFDEVLSAGGEGFAEDVAIVVPSGVTWSLPAYELALLTAAHSPRSHVTLVTHEPAPLCAFGGVASAGVAAILEKAGITLRAGEQPTVVSPTAIRVGWEWIEASRIVALPLLSGRRLPGIPCDSHGFVEVDAHGRAKGLDDVYAAGDGTTLAIKQGGLAAQQADAVAAHIASRLGADVAAAMPRPVLRGLLLTTDGSRYLRAELDDPEGTSTISDEPLWWPPSKIASRWLVPYLEHLDAVRVSGLVPMRDAVSG